MAMRSGFFQSPRESAMFMFVCIPRELPDTMRYDSNDTGVQQNKIERPTLTASAHHTISPLSVLATLRVLLRGRERNLWHPGPRAALQARAREGEGGREKERAKRKGRIAAGCEAGLP